MLRVMRQINKNNNNYLEERANLFSSRSNLIEKKKCNKTFQKSNKSSAEIPGIEYWFGPISSRGYFPKLFLIICFSVFMGMSRVIEIVSKERVWFFVNLLLNSLILWMPRVSNSLQKEWRYSVFISLDKRACKWSKHRNFLPLRSPNKQKIPFIFL